MIKYFNSFLIFLIFSLLLNQSLQASEEFILRSETNFNPSFHNRFSFLLGVNPSLTKSTDVTNITFSYGKKMEDFWLDTNFLITNGLFSKMTTNNSDATTLLNSKLVDKKSNFISFGVGVARESRYSQNLLPFKDLYELMAADITYNLYKESASTKTFTGPGMIAKFSLLKKFSEYTSLGTHFTYNLAVIKRSQDFATENSSSRSLTLSYMTLGFDFSFYL